MPPVILHISGPARSGKTTFARALAARFPEDKPHYVRFDHAGREPPPSLRFADPLDEMGASIRRTATPQLVFEEVSEAVKDVAGGHPMATIIMETDAQPCFRHAYPYDVKLFIMAPPPALDVVFRSPVEAAQAVERAMDDTSEFAAELFGLDRESLGSGILPALGPKDRRTKATPTQTAEEFIDSEVGTEIAARMQLQPDYHAIIDSDVVLLNEGIDHDPEAAVECSGRLDALLETLRRKLKRQSWFAACNPLDPRDPLTIRALTRIEALLKAARTSSL